MPALPRIDERWRASLGSGRRETFVLACAPVASAFTPETWSGHDRLSFTLLVAAAVAVPLALLFAWKRGLPGLAAVLEPAFPLVLPPFLAAGVLASARPYSIVSMGPYLLAPIAAIAYRRSAAIAVSLGLGGALVAALEFRFHAAGTPPPPLVSNVVLPSLLYALLAGGAERERVLAAENAALRRSLARSRLEGQLLALARDVHDGLGAHLSAAAAHAEVAVRAAPVDPARAKSSAAKLRERVNAAVRELDELSHLTPEMSWAACGERLRATAAELSRPGADIGFHAAESGPLVPGAVAAGLHRVLQEGVSNALRHGRASRVTVTLDHAENEGRLAIEDDGRGLGGEAPVGFGGRGIRARVEAIGGTARWERTGGEGTRLVVTWPLGSGR